MRVLIIANPLVGIRKEKKAVVDTVTSAIRDNGGAVDITYIMKHGVGVKHASRAVLEGYDAVFAAGGDGTVNEVASGLVKQGIPLGIIPLGTGNGLARGLGIPFDTESIVPVLTKNRTLTIDAGKISSHYFFATAGIGFDAYIAEDFNRKRGSKTGLFGYFATGIMNYFTRRPEQLVLRLGKEELKRQVFALTFCNTPQYGGGATIAPQANPSDGQLVAVLIPKFGVLKALPAIKSLFNGTIQHSSDVEFITFKSITIKRRAAGIYHVDGETFEGGRTLDVTVVPSALDVIVP